MTRFPLQRVCPLCGPLLHSYTSLPSPPDKVHFTTGFLHLPQTPPLPPVQPLQGTLEGEGTVGFVSPIFHSGDKWSRQEEGHATWTRCSQRSKGGALRKPLILLSPFSQVPKSFGIKKPHTHPQGVANSHAYWVLASDLVAKCGTPFPFKSPAFTQLQVTTRWR